MEDLFEEEFEDLDEEQDIIDVELEKLIDEFSEEDDDGSVILDLDIITLTINQMIDDEEIEDVPTQEDSEEEKKEWIEKSIPLIREKLKQNDSDLG